jgi:hypothetical protein
MAAGIMDDEESANRCILCTMAMACISCYTDAPTPTQKTHTQTQYTQREGKERERERERRTRQLFRRSSLHTVILLYYIYLIFLMSKQFLFVRVFYDQRWPLALKAPFPLSSLLFVSVNPTNWIGQLH